MEALALKVVLKLILSQTLPKLHSYCMEHLYTLFSYSQFNPGRSGLEEARVAHINISPFQIYNI